MDFNRFSCLQICNIVTVQQDCQLILYRFRQTLVLIHLLSMCSFNSSTNPAIFLNPCRFRYWYSVCQRQYRVNERCKLQCSFGRERLDSSQGGDGIAGLPLWVRWYNHLNCRPGCHRECSTFGGEHSRWKERRYRF